MVLAGNDVRMSPSSPLLEKVQGTVQFSESEFGLTGVQARMLGGPVRIDGGLRPVAGAANTESTLQLRAQGRVTAEALRTPKKLSPLNDWAQQATADTGYNAQLAGAKANPSSRSKARWRAGPEFARTLGQVRHQQRTLIVAKPCAKHRRRAARSTAGRLGPLRFAHFVRDVSGADPVVLRGTLTLGQAAAQAPPCPAQA